MTTVLVPIGVELGEGVLVSAAIDALASESTSFEVGEAELVF